MKRINLLFVLLISTLSVFSQLQKPQIQIGTKAKGVEVQSTLYVKSAIYVGRGRTNFTPTKPCIIFDTLLNDYYKWNGSWSILGSGGGGSGTVNNGNQFRIGYYAVTGTGISPAAAITPSRLLVSDANGVPVHSTITATEAATLANISTNIQAQLNGKQTNVSIVGFGSSPNANGLSFVGNTGLLNMQPANSGNPGGISINDQSMGNGIKWFENKVSIGLPRITASSALDFQIFNFGYQKNTTPASGSFRFGDGTGWHFNWGRKNNNIHTIEYTQDQEVIMTMNDAGNIGIGLNGGQPGARLQVRGPVRLDSLGVAPTKDTTNYKPAALNSSGDLVPMADWGATVKIWAGKGVKITFSNDSMLVRIDSVPTLNVRTANYVLTIADQWNTVVKMNVAGANTITIPPASSVAWPIGTTITFYQLGAGQTTVVAGAGVTINSAGGRLKIAEQYGWTMAVYAGSDVWDFSGNTAL